MAPFAPWLRPCSADDRMRLKAFLRRCHRLGYCDDTSLTFNNICADADERLFTCITSNRRHLLHPLLPPAATGATFYANDLMAAVLRKRNASITKYAKNAKKYVIEKHETIVRKRIHRVTENVTDSTAYVCAYV